MTSTTMTTFTTGLGARIAREGYGPGAWHGPDLKAALDDVTKETALRRPSPDRHNIAEIALHHAYTARAVRGQLSGAQPEPFVLEGEDWFVVSDETRLTWERIRAVVEAEQRELMQLITKMDSGKLQSPLGDEERMNLVLGITCHACYHAGQVQLIKRLIEP
jgi:hypothetical protein